jgi:hypothetical protein
MHASPATCISALTFRYLSSTAGSETPCMNATPSLSVAMSIVITGPSSFMCGAMCLHTSHFIISA